MKAAQFGDTEHAVVKTQNSANVMRGQGAAAVLLAERSPTQSALQQRRHLGERTRGRGPCPSRMASDLRYDIARQGTSHGRF